MDSFVNLQAVVIPYSYQLIGVKLQKKKKKKKSQKTIMGHFYQNMGPNPTYEILEMCSKDFYEFFWL